MSKEYWNNEVNKVCALVDREPTNDNCILLKTACFNYISLFGEKELWINCRVILSIYNNNFKDITIFKCMSY